MDPRQFSKPGKGTISPSMVSPQSESPVRDNAKVSESQTSPETQFQDTDIKGDQVIDSYLKYLKEHGIEQEDVFSTLNSIITEGEAFWQFLLLNKVPVVFKMRPAWVNDKLMDRLDNDQPKSHARFIDLVGRYNLAGSLVQYGDYHNEVTSEEALEKNIEFVSCLPYIMQNRLIKQMAIFDRLVAVATSDWAVENFTEPLSAE